MPPATSKVVCTCKRCRQEQVKIHGRLQPGRLVSATTRSRHRNKDNENDHFAATNSQPEPLMQESTSNIDDEVSGEGLGPKPLVHSEPSPNSARQLLYVLICTLAVWLHLVCGLSREATNSALKVIEVVVTMAINLGQLIAQIKAPETACHSSELVEPPTFKLPHDVRTAMNNLSLEPKIIRSICCPKCLTKYSLESLPATCSQRETPRSKACGETLWTTRNTQAGPCVVPCRLYNTQDFKSWLEFFLSRPGIEDLIDKSYAHRPTSDIMHSIWDSPSWRSLGAFTTTPGNLTFSYYIDWFNPFTNKISGKTASCGAIILVCLNLPYELQHLFENTFFAGITPPPHEPTVVTITAVSDPIIDQFMEMWHGVKIQTYRYPAGVNKKAAILAGIGDLLAMRKALGFAGVASHKFCSFCKLLKADIDDLNYQSWQLRIGVDVRAAAESWQQAKTKKERNEIFKTHGVRWSSLHQLIYRDPVRHTVLGLMHNWIEGILQHHARFKWGIGTDLSVGNTGGIQEDTSDENLPFPGSSKNIDEDIEILCEELIALRAESQEFDDKPVHLKRQHSELSLMDLDDPGEQDADDEDFQLENEEEDDDDGSGNEDSKVAEQKVICIFTSAELSSIHSCLADTVIPSWLERPPTNLGNKSHGGLKADQWLKLFTVFLPLILPEMWLSSPSKKHLDLLSNFYDLVACTNIVCAHSTSPALADLYLKLYIQYRKSSTSLFPNIRSRPNHHYAMHNGELMKFWGPLIKISEFLGERHNGTLQKIKTNSHLWELDFTMLRQICRRGRLAALIGDSGQLPLEPTDLFSKAFQIFSQAKQSKKDLDINKTSKVHSLLDEVSYNGEGEPLSMENYSLILDYINLQSPNAPFRHFMQLPHPIGAHVLPPRAVPAHHLTHNGRTYSSHSRHAGNSSISYSVNGQISAGFIQSMWTQILKGHLRTFLIVAPHMPLSSEDNQKNPYSTRHWFKCALVYSQPVPANQHSIIEQGQILAHVPYYQRPPGTFKINAATTVLINSLQYN